LLNSLDNSARATNPGRFFNGPTAASDSRADPAIDLVFEVSDGVFAQLDALRELAVFFKTPKLAQRIAGSRGRLARSDDTPIRLHDER
jgi:hypothetical protein